MTEVSEKFFEKQISISIFLFSIEHFFLNHRHDRHFCQCKLMDILLDILIVTLTRRIMNI